MQYLKQNPITDLFSYQVSWLYWQSVLKETVLRVSWKSGPFFVCKNKLLTVKLSNLVGKQVHDPTVEMSITLNIPCDMNYVRIKYSFVRVCSAFLQSFCYRPDK